jgi:Uma2 family endonuclease
MTTIDHSLQSSDVSDIKPHPGRSMTEEEFVEWSGDAWVEWVDGEVVVMSPVNLRHAILFSFLFPLLQGFVEQRGAGQALTEPFQMRLGKQRRRRSPDVMFVATERLSALQTNHLEGPADLVFEIVSPDSLARDWREKYLEYEAASVREYCVIDPMAQRVEAYALNVDSRYRPIPETDGKINSLVLPGFYLRPTWFWQEKLPKVLETLREMGAIA